MFVSVIPVAKSDTHEVVGHHLFLGITPEILGTILNGQIDSIHLRDLPGAEESTLNLPDMDIILMFAPSQDHLVELMKKVGAGFNLEVEVHDPRKD